MNADGRIEQIAHPLIGQIEVAILVNTLDEGCEIPRAQDRLDADPAQGLGNEIRRLPRLAKEDVLDDDIRVNRMGHSFADFGAGQVLVLEVEFKTIDRFWICIALRLDAQSLKPLKATDL